MHAENLALFADFVAGYSGRYIHEHVYSNQEFERNQELQKKLRGEIIARMAPGTQGLLDLYNEALTREASMYQDAAFMAGFKLALELIMLCQNPQPFVSPPWCKVDEATYWREIEERIQEIIGDRKAGEERKAG
ncbi:hypothetical protein [Desulfofundulus thermocisternus]|uniref:hypothetical protein n=1 Tax=Desulfofundulus thermocisternus TaxID=42471 RepID=UPI00217E8557|nr:hypothetical protein [Desulfofundulus thermocisternus]MCS5696326.1 hypothetical protein [Desulfofundulus thermocisternus]